MDQFVHAKSLLAPGAAGLSTTLITGTLVTQFDFLPSSWTALTISFLFGLMVWADRRVPIWKRLIVFILNSLIIFTVAIGINTAGVAASGGAQYNRQRDLPPQDVEEEKPFFHEWF